MKWKIVCNKSTDKKFVTKNHCFWLKYKSSVSIILLSIMQLSFWQHPFTAEQVVTKLCIYIYLSIYLSIHTHTPTYLPIYLYLPVYLSTHIHIYIYIYIYIYIHTYKYINLYLPIYIPTPTIYTDNIQAIITSSSNYSVVIVNVCLIND